MIKSLFWIIVGMFTAFILIYVGIITAKDIETAVNWTNITVAIS